VKEKFAMTPRQEPKEVVLSYIKAMDERDYGAALRYLSESVFIKGPAGEAFRSPVAFLDMMKEQRGRYDLKKTFVDGSDVCVIYDFVTPTAIVFFCSWYQVKEGKIVSIQTIFDSRAFASA
jgi:limonene-1,2-epoxide hydrolase